MTKTLVRSAAQFKKLQWAARDALRAALELDRVLDADLFGRYLLPKDEALDEENVNEVVDLLRFAREQYPRQEIEIIVLAHLENGD